MFWWAIGVGLWLCRLPVLLRVRPLPVLLQRLTPVPGRRTHGGPQELERAVRLVAWLCQGRLWRWPLFPRACLFQSLALYYGLTRLGYPVVMHVGVCKAGQELRGHSWVTVAGKPVAERTPPGAFRTIYTFPPTSSDVSPPAPLPEGEELFSDPAGHLALVQASSADHWYSKSHMHGNVTHGGPHGK